jgi:DNA-binding NtrC family response regulator
MQKVIRVVERIAPSEVAVLLTGESGAGKELIADYIHIRSGRPLSQISKISCSALEPPQLEEFYLGARNGTLVLRDLCELPSRTQATLLGLLDIQTAKTPPDESGGGPRARIIAVTNHAPEEAVRQGLLIPELFYRINAITLHLPPLRERREDIMPLAIVFLNRFAAQAGRTMKGFTQAAMDALTRFTWPGNVNQLQNEIQRAILFSKGNLVDASHFSILSAGNTPPPEESQDTNFTLLEDVERNTIVRMLRETGGNKLETAKRLGIGRQTLYNKIKAYGIEVPGREA